LACKIDSNYFKSFLHSYYILLRSLRTSKIKLFKMQQRLIFAILFIATQAINTAAVAQNSSKKQTNSKSSTQYELYATRAEAMQMADDIAGRRDLDNAIGQARNIGQISRLMQPAPRGVAKNWRVYRSRFIDPIRIKAGVKFWQDNAATLAKAEKEYGVPAEIIVGIIGVETIYGRDTGSYRVIDALTTLTFDFPASHPRAAERQAFFKGELEHFLSLTSRSGVDPLSPRGSYAGAMGLPQFMPSSWVKYAIDFDEDGKVDLFTSPADVIGSVANYFKAFKWQPGLPTHYPVTFDTTKLDMDALMAPDILPTFSVTSFMAKGANLNAVGAAHTGPLALIELQNGDPSIAGNTPSYVAGTENFYAITRYNWSSYYAMSVIDLGREVALQMGK
jgi:membrane-bound lytic murein transglycosylase B